MGFTKPGKSSRESIEKLSERVGVPITGYVNDRRPVINGRTYTSYQKAYAYLYGLTRTKKTPL